MQTARTSLHSISGRPSVDLNLPWQARPLVRIQLAAEVTGLSVTSIYRLSEQKRLTLKRIAGRVLVETSGLLKLIEDAELWTPSKRGEAARAARAASSRDKWR